MRQLRTLAFLYALAVGDSLAAQVPVAGPGLDADQARFGTHWRRVVSPHFEVLFASGLEAEAQRAATLLEQLREPLGKTMGAPPKRITVVLQSQSALSNGYVTLGPRRSVWVTTPPLYPALLGAGDWLTLLAAHETRHVAQGDQTDIGVTHVLRVLLGDAGQSIGELFIPLWMWEGDAVGTETALTESGRGRMPEFDKEIRALALDGRLPNYYQAANGSYERFFPDWYHLGYLLTTRMRRAHGEDAVARVFRNTAARWRFQSAMRSATKLTPAQLYDSTMHELTQLWRQQSESLRVTEAARLTPVPSVYTNYQDPQYLADGSLVAIRDGLADVTQLVRIADGRVTRLADAGAIAGIRAGGTVVAWIEFAPNARWGWHQHTRIRAYDVTTRRTFFVGRAGRYGFPAPSPDGSRIAAIEATEAGGSDLVVLGRSGAVLQRIRIPDGEHAMDPAWRADGGAIALTRQGTRGKALSVVDLSTGSFTDLVPHGVEDVRRPTFAAGQVLYVSSYSGVDNVYAIDPRGGARWQVTSRRLGAYEPDVSADGRRLAFADYTSDGFAVAEMPLDSAQWIPIAQVPQRAVRYFEPLVEQEQFTLRPVAMPADSTRYPVRRVGARGAINVHSWYPILNYGSYGAGVTSTNVLNTVATTLDASYNTNEKQAAVTAGASYAGLYPIFDVSGTAGARSASYELPGDTAIVYDWHERGVELGARVPLRFARGLWRRSAEFGAHVGAQWVSGLELADVNPPGNGSFAPVTYAFTASNVRGRAPRDLAPTWAQAISAQYRYTPLGGDFHARKATALAQMFLPAPVRHHGLLIGGSIEAHRLDPISGYRFDSDIPRPRGYDFLFATRMAWASVNYAFPLGYPDLNLTRHVYVRRVTGGVFYDWFGRGGLAAPGVPVTTREMSSAGAQLLAEITPFSIRPLSFSVGARLVYRVLDGKWRVEPVVSAGAF